MNTKAAPSKHDLVSVTILRSKLEAVVAEMEATLVNTAYSSTISVASQCAAALFTEQGELIAVSNPLYMYPMAMTAAAVIDRFQYDLSSDDAIITNDPYGGGTRVQNFTLVAPVSAGDSIVLYLAVCGHTEDFGGDVRGNFNPKAFEIWGEGARCPPVRLVREGKTCRDMLQTLSLNSRNPVAFGLDVQAMLAAAAIGKQRLGDLFNSYGTEALFASVQWLLDYSERRMRALLGQIPSGRYEGTSVLNHDGHGKTNLTVRVALQIGAGAVAIDFTGTDPQSAGFVNTTRAAAATFAFLPFLTVFSGEVPCNAGAMRCVTVAAPARSLVDPAYPAPTGWCLQHVGHEIAQAVTAALSHAVPGKVGRVTANAFLLFSVYRLARHGQTIEQMEAFDFSSLAQGDADAAAEHDGWGTPGVSARTPLPSIELYEAGRGGRIEQLEYALDSAGAGLNRGGPGTVAIVSLPRPAAGDLHLTASVVASATPGLLNEGGHAGLGNAIAVQCQAEMTEVTELLADWKLPGDATLTIRMGGGRGWGDAALRPPERVRADVADGFVSAEAAQAIYKVVVDPATFALDEVRTRELRGGARAAKPARKEKTHG